MPAGLYDKIIIIQRPTVTQNDYGEEEQEYVDLYQTRARVLHRGGSRDVENAEILHNITKQLEMYRFVELQFTDYIKMCGQQYRVVDIEDNRELNKKIVTVELVND